MPAIAVGCCSLGHPVNGQVELSNTTVRSTANYTCNQGYILSNGNSTRTCEANGEWSGSSPSCECGWIHMYVIFTRCTYSQCMPRAHLHDVWTNMCGLLLVGVARAFRSCMCNEVYKVWEGRQSVSIMLKEFESVSVFLNCTECENTAVSQDNHALYLLR